MSTPPPPPPPPGYGGQPPGYGAPPPGYGGPPSGYQQYGSPPSGPREYPGGTTVLVLGILSLVLCQLLGPVAWIMGSNALRAIDAAPGAYTNRGTVSAGKICGMIATIIMLVAIAFTVVAILIAIAAGGSDTSWPVPG